MKLHEVLNKGLGYTLWIPNTKWEFWRIKYEAGQVAFWAVIFSMVFWGNYMFLFSQNETMKQFLTLSIYLCFFGNLATVLGIIYFDRYAKYIFKELIDIGRGVNKE